MIDISNGKYTLQILTILYIYQQSIIHKGRFPRRHIAAYLHQYSMKMCLLGMTFLYLFLHRLLLVIFFVVRERASSLAHDLAQQKKQQNPKGSAVIICRDNRIRTCDPQLPKLVR